MNISPKEKLESFSHLIDTYTKGGKEILDELLKNEAIPLFDRWNFFMKYGQMFYPVSDYIMAYHSTARPWFDEQDRWPENRGQRIIYADYFEEDWIDEDQFDPLTGKRPEWLTEELIAEIKESFEKIPEEVVRDLFNQGLSGCTFDW